MLFYSFVITELQRPLPFRCRFVAPLLRLPLAICYSVARWQSLPTIAHGDNSVGVGTGAQPTPLRGLAFDTQ